MSPEHELATMRSSAEERIEALLQENKNLRKEANRALKFLYEGNILRARQVLRGFLDPPVADPKER